MPATIFNLRGFFEYLLLFIALCQLFCASSQNFGSRLLLNDMFAKKQIMQTSSRQTYLDWLRILAILGVLLYHGARPFITDDPWHVNNATTSDLLTEFNFWLSRFRMHLLFFISGAVSWFMMRKRTAGSFVGLRLRRLFVPLLVGMVIIVPPQIYMERLTQGFKGSFFDFYPTVFNFEPYPKGNTSWHHLWFIAYLFVYDILLAPFFAWSVSDKGKLFVAKLQWLATGKRIYLIMLPSVIWFSLTVLKYPDTNDLIHDYCYVIYWLLFLMAGFLCMLQPALMDSLARNRRFSLGMAFLFILGINYLRWNDIELAAWLPNWENDWRTYVYIARQPINSWLWVFAAVGYGKTYLNKTHPALAYINQTIYPFYILHQTVIVVIAYYVIQTTDTIGMKYIFIVLVSFIVSIGIFHLYIRPFAITRFLFGMKPKELAKENVRSKIVEERASVSVNS